MICPNCQTPNSNDGKFCKKCGTSLTAIVCPCCKKENAADATFCTYCGTSLDVAEKQQSESAPVKTTQSEEKEEKEKDGKSKGGVLLLLTQILVGLAVAAMVFTLICRFAYQKVITEIPSEYKGFAVCVDVYPFVGDMDNYYFHGSSYNSQFNDEDYPPSTVVIDNMVESAVNDYQLKNWRGLLWCAFHLAWTLGLYFIVKKVIIPKKQKK